MENIQVDKKPESGLGEFWDKWLEEAEQEEQVVERLRLQRKREGSGYDEVGGSDKPI